MADQACTPTSAADSSVAGSSKPPNTTNPSGSGSGSVAGGSSAPKDKACPFCGQPFTSSSLGRHLDLYIKEKNPKPADGLHDVDEIRKMRGAITRRQPRGSSGRREGSTPAGTPGGTPALRSGQGESDMGTPSRSNSGGGTRAGMVQRQPMTQEKGKVTTALNQVNWQSTGVINNIPIMHQRNDLNAGSNVATGAADGMAEGRRTVSRQIAAKNTFEQKQKMLDAMEGQRAAELALREILGSIKAAITVAQPSLTASPFDFDPLTLSFPSLVLTCLPPPPTISQISPIAHPNSWFTDPPSQVQFKALTAHFRDRFHNVNVMRTLVASTPPHPDDILYAHHAAPEVQAAISQQAKQYEEQITSHLHQAFQHWMQTQPAQREELWKLELARAVGLKSQRASSLEQVLESVQQENAHLKYQVESLSRLQNPKEFAMSAPQTLSLNRREAVKLAELGMRGRSTGFRIGDSEESLQKRVEQAVERWKPVVRRSRAGMQNQRSLSGQMRPGQSMSDIQNGMGGQSQQMNSMPSEMELDAEADMDADAEADEENYNQAQAQMQQQQQQRSGTSTPIMQQHMIQAGYPNIQAQQQNLRGQQQMNVGNVNGMAMMNLQQQHAAAQQAAQQQAQMGGQQQQQQMSQGQQGENSNSMANGQHQGMTQAQQQQMAVIRRQQQQSGVAAQMNGGRAGGRINVPF